MRPVLGQTLFKEFFEELSEVLFLRNALFGAVFVGVSLFFSPRIFLSGFFCASLGYGWSRFNRTPKILKDGGLLTVNGFFFGIAMASLFHASLTFYCCLTIGALIVPVVTKAAFEILQHWKLSPFIISYVLVVWVFYLGAKVFGFEFIDQTMAPNSLLMTFDPSSMLNPLVRVLFSILSSMGRLFFFADPIYGFALLALVSLFNLRLGVFFLGGTAISVIVAFFLSMNHPQNALLGKYSYCAGLVGIALASFHEKYNYKMILSFCIISLFLTVASEEILRNLNLPGLSLPYVMTLWIAILSRVPRLNVSWTQ